MDSQRVRELFSTINGLGAAKFMETFWIDLLKKYRLAFTEWAKKESSGIVDIAKIDQSIDPNWIEITYSSKFYKENRLLISSYRIWSFPHYFDALGISIGIHLRHSGSFEPSVLNLSNKSQLWQYKGQWVTQGYVPFDNYPNRLEATKAGVQKAFEIREAQLKQAQENDKESN